LNFNQVLVVVVVVGVVVVVVVVVVFVVGGFRISVTDHHVTHYFVYVRVNLGFREIFSTEVFSKSLYFSKNVPECQLSPRM
jgi:hypothetical protein